MRSEGYDTLSVCVCACFKLHLTSGVSVRPENAVTYSAGNGLLRLGIWSFLCLANVLVHCFPCISVYCYCLYGCLVVCLPLTPLDPSLTPDNILQSARNIPLWNKGDSYIYLNMQRSVHDEITAKYNGEQAKSELVSTWLSNHPCPTWEHVTGLLRELERNGRGKKGAAEEVEETYLKSELKCFSEIHVQLCLKSKVH